MSQVSFNQTIDKYYKCASDPHSRFRSWDYCYDFFRKNYNKLHLPEVEDDAARQLGLYLASWGMYRGSGFLLQYAYTVHKPVVHALAHDRFSDLWQHDVGAKNSDIELTPIIMDLVELVRKAYCPFARRFGKKPTDTLITKVLLGTVGCLPARDTYFKDGFKNQGFVYGNLNPDPDFVDRILRFCIDNRPKLVELQPNIRDLAGRPYPLMKLVDMHFWQIGYDLNSS